jgi:predicted ATPase/DNA-binding winged helix-turn-helix (wHTH) protein
MSSGGIHRLRFGPFELSTDQRELRRDGVVLPLGSRALDILIYLAERPGEVIAKKELIDRVWPDVTVEEGSLRVHVAAIRKALGDGKFGNRYIANIQGRGYSFVGSIVGLDDSAANIADQQSLGALPARLRRMIGRDLVLSEVRDSLREERFVTLLGPGGIGKTTIAAAVGHDITEEFGGEVYFVDFGSLTDPDHVVRAIGTSLGLVLKSNEASLELVDLIRSRKLLIILDSCEHVVEAVASVAEQLFQGARQVHLLATSRELLRVEGEHCHRILPLDSPPADSEQTAGAVLCYPAAQLFVERVAARGSNFVLTDGEAPFIADMCRRLDGLPLAIELAAGPAAALGVRSTVARLVSRLELLKPGHRTAIRRHQTLKATLDWSYDLLSNVERIVFRRIARLVGHFSLEGARYLACEQSSVDAEIFDAIAGLVEKSLVATRLDQGEPRYRLLDTTRAYALEKLEEHAEFDAISQRHAEYVTGYLESQKEVLSALPGAESVAGYSRQLGNVRSALEWSFGPHGNDGIAMRLATASTQLFMELSLLIECQYWAEQAIARLGDHDKNSRREMELCASLPLALMYTEAGNLRVRAAFSRALDVAVRQGDLANELRLLSGLFGYSYWTIDIDEALDIAARSRKVALKTQDRDHLALAESMLGTANHLIGNHKVAQRHFEAGLRYTAFGSRFRAGQDLFPYTSFSVVGMARSLLYKGSLDQALEYAKRAIELGEKSGRPGALCRSIIMVLPVFLVLADFERSESYIAQSTEVSTAYSLLPYRTAAIGLRGQWLLLRNNPGEAIPLLKRALEELHAQCQEMLGVELVCDLAAGLVVVDRHEEALGLILNAIDGQERAKKFLHMPALLRMKGLILASRSPEGYPEAERSLLSSIDWARRQSSTLFELKSATDLAELLLSQNRMPEAYRHISAALSRTSDEIVSPVHDRARQILSRFQSSATAAG